MSFSQLRGKLSTKQCFRLFTEIASKIKYRRMSHQKTHLFKEEKVEKELKKIFHTIVYLLKLNIFKKNGVNKTMVLILFFWKNMYIFMIWRVSVCGRRKSVEIQQMILILLQTSCILLSGNQEYGLVYGFWFLLLNIHFHPSLILRKIMYIIKSNDLFF